MGKSDYDLNKLAAELAAMDCPRGRNMDVVAARSIIAALGRKLRKAAAAERRDIMDAIATRAGRRQKVCRTALALLALLAFSGCMSDKQWSDTAAMHANYMAQQRTMKSVSAQFVPTGGRVTLEGVTSLTLEAPLNPLTTIPQYPEFAREVVQGVQTVAGYAALGYIGAKAVDNMAAPAAKAAP